MSYLPNGMVSGPAIELENKDYTPKQRSGGDHFAHAAGRICKRCDLVIEAGQPARRRGEVGWVHDVCPD